MKSYRLNLISGLISGRILRLTFGLILCAGLVTVSGCSKRSSDNQNGGQAAAPAAKNVADVITVEKRENKAPNFSWKDSTGATIDMAAFGEKVNVINFWATWCGPCKKELPDLIALNNEYAGRGVRFLGLSADVGSNVLDDVSSFVAESGINYQVVIANDDLKEAFGNVNMLPTTFITDKDGNILTTLIGARSKEAFAEAINGFLQQ